MIKIHLPCWFLIILFNLLAFPVYGDGLKPKIRQTDLATAITGKRTDLIKIIANQIVNFHQNVISRIDGDRCKMKPTCSAYAKEAFQNYGIWGSFMAVDRMLHEGDEYKVSPVVKAGGILVTYDPVANNNFWWHDKKSTVKKKEEK